MFTEPPAMVGRTEVQLLRDAATRMKRTDMRSGAGYALDTADEFGSQAKMVLGATCPSSLTAERATAAAWVFNTTAFMHHDVGHHAEADSWWWLALQTVKAANNWSLTARILGQQARQHLALHNPRAALNALSTAIEGDRRRALSPTDLAMLHALRARAFGLMGRGGETLAAIGVADTHMHSERTDHDADERPWIGHYDVPHHQGDTAAALRSLVGHGQRHAAAAIGLYEQAFDDTADGNERSRVLVCGSLAQLHLTDGDVDKGLVLGHTMLELVKTQALRSQRVVERIHRVYKAADTIQHPGIGHLREHVVETLKFVA